VPACRSLDCVSIFALTANDAAAVLRAARGFDADDPYARREPAIAGMRGGVRYQVYESIDGFVLFMASEQHFWKKFTAAVDRPELFERWPGSQYGDHARNNLELRDELAAIFKGRTSQEWLGLAEQANTTIAPVNTPKTIADDPQFQDRFPWMPASEHGIDMISTPIKLLDEELPPPAMAPTVGQHTDEVLREVLGYDEARIDELRSRGAFGRTDG
jgi:crotonobetainyl-CoA:carnitine CoA-transferase CaiB-like acyl-CoA transferase